MLLNFLLFHFLLLGSKKCNIWDSLIRPFLFNTFFKDIFERENFQIWENTSDIGTWYFEKDIWPGIVSSIYYVFFESRLIIFIESSIHLK